MTAVPDRWTPFDRTRLIGPLLQFRCPRDPQRTREPHGPGPARAPRVGDNGEVPALGHADQTSCGRQAEWAARVADGTGRKPQLTRSWQIWHQSGRSHGPLTRAPGFILQRNGASTTHEKPSQSKASALRRAAPTRSPPRSCGRPVGGGSAHALWWRQMRCDQVPLGIAELLAHARTLRERSEYCFLSSETASSVVSHE